MQAIGLSNQGSTRANNVHVGLEYMAEKKEEKCGLVLDKDEEDKIYA